MLAAARRAAAEVDADLVLVPAGSGLELGDEFEHAVLGLGDGEVAELDAGAAHAAFAEVRGLVVEAERVEVGLERGEIRLGHVQDEEILLCGETDRVQSGRAIFFGEGAEFAEDAIADASAGEADADPVKIALLLLVNAEVIGLLVFDDGEVRVPLHLEIQQFLHFRRRPFSMPPRATNRRRGT